MSEKKKQTFDSPWKQVIETFFPQFMSFFVPGSENDIDWTREIKFLDKELQKVTKASVAGQKYADKLIEVTLKDKSRKWILIHIEIQSQKQVHFSQRMFVYNYRIYDRYNIPVTSIAILADNSLSWDPEPFQYGMWGSSMGLIYLKTKLLDYRGQWSWLQRQNNPFAIVVMAHLKALETQKDHSLRKQWKIELTRLLYERGYSKTEVINLYSFIDWVLTLPEALEKIFLEDLMMYEKEKNMPYITSAERIGREKGKQEGRKEGRQEGRKEGRKEGKLELYIELIQNMKKNNLSDQEIARLINLDIEIVKKVLNNEHIDIPLHLLNR
ncbi:RpnC/YadD family protein [Desulfobacter sp.]